MSVIPQENRVRTSCAVIVKSPRRTKNTTHSKFTTRSIFSTGGPLGPPTRNVRGRSDPEACEKRPSEVPLGTETAPLLKIIRDAVFEAEEEGVEVAFEALRHQRKISEKDQGATRLGATGLRGSEREICL